MHRKSWALSICSLRTGLSSSWVGVERRGWQLLMRISASLLGPRGKSQVALKIIRNVGKYREAARLEINVLKKIKEKDKENKL